MQGFLVNGRTAQVLDLHDRAVHYGDGLFETLAIANGIPLCWERHMARLAHGCRVLGIEAPPAELLRQEAEQLCNGRDRAVLKIIVSRGSGGRGYSPPREPRTVRIVGVYDWPEIPPRHLREGLALGVCRIRVGWQPALAGIKHLNRLEQVLARRELAYTGADDGLLLDGEDHVIEATASNVFAVSGAQLLTPDLSSGGIAGIVRSVILDRARDWGLTVHVRSFTLADLLAADEVFLSNSIAGVVAARSVGEHELGMGATSGRVRGLLVRENCIIA